MSDYDNIQNALNHIDPQDRETWFRMGAAIKDELGENGFEMWDNWSRQADNYKQTDAQSVWKSIKTGHIHIATLFKVARENGYCPEHPYTPPSPETLAQRAQIAQEKQRAEAERIAQAHAKAEKAAYGIWKNASPADPKHAYAQSKGLDADRLKGIRQNEYQGKKQLIIPLYSEKKLVNVQTIDEDGNKKFLNGGQKQGAYTIIGDFKQNQQGIILAEGFATAASVHKATGKPVVVAFDAGNLRAVSEKLLNVLPENVPVYFAADNDPSQTGLHKAQAAAEVWGERAQILLPEFSDKQIAEFQEKFGENKIPTDFNDLHKLAGIDAVREQFGLAIAREPEMRAETDFRLPENAEPQEIRTAWNDFPPVISNGKLGDLKNEPEYPAAKAGDVVQSALLVEKLLKDETVQEIKNLIGDNQPILVPIQSEEASGKNRIPHATAHALADKLGLQVDTDIVQSNTAKRTDTGIYHRYVAPPEFKGEVQAGKSYLIVDDTLSVGGTIATLKGYIENKGGKVIGSTVMTAHALKVDIPIQLNMLQSLQQKQGLNEYWKQEFGYSVDKLTQQEAGHLRKPTLEQIQERVQEARQNLSQNKELNHEQTTQSVETQQRPVHPAPEIDGARISGTETVWQGRGQVLQSVFQQPQPPRNEEVSPPTQAATSEKDVAVSFSEKENSMENENPQKHDLPEPEFRQPEPETATSENDVAVSVSETNQAEQETPSEKIGQPEPPNLEPDEPEQEMHNTIEYEAFQREIAPAEPEKAEFRQPENPSVAQTPPAENIKAAQAAFILRENPAPNEYKVWIRSQDDIVSIEELQNADKDSDDYPNPAPDFSRDDFLRALEKGTITVYHGGISDTLQNGEFVTPSKMYAQDYGSNVVRKEVPFTDLAFIKGTNGLEAMYIPKEALQVSGSLKTENRQDNNLYGAPALAILEHHREERATNSITEAERLKQQSAVPERPDSASKTIPQEAVKAADTVQAHATQAQQTSAPKPSDTAKAQYESKLATLPTEQQHKARFYERQALAAMRHMPAEFHEKTRQAIYENQTDLIRDGKYHATDPMKSVERQPEKAQEKTHERAPSRDDWEMER